MTSEEQTANAQPSEPEHISAEDEERRRRDASAAALTLEIVGDLPHAEIKPPENVLFVCKLNPVTKSEDLELIFSRFGKINNCEVIKDKKSSAEQAYFKMQNVLIDDRRIWVDFSQSVSKLHGVWNKQRAKRGTHVPSRSSRESYDDLRRSDASGDHCREWDDRPRRPHRDSRGERRSGYQSYERNDHRGNSHRDYHHRDQRHREDRYRDRPEYRMRDSRGDGYNSRERGN